MEEHGQLVSACGAERGLAIGVAGNAAEMLFLLLLLAALVVLGIVLAVVVIKWLFILAIVAALVWVIAFFTRGISRRA
jgi:hypothetical protein